MIKQLTRQEVEAVVEKLETFDNTYCSDCNDICDVVCSSCNHSYDLILLGDVLEKNKYDDYIPSGFYKSKRERVVNLWGECGFSKSLQEIISESGYKNLDLLSDSPEYREVLKSFEANQLFTFLQQLL